ncbi:MAG: cation:proton antiporter [Deltaproteobacteria bacterium]|nr:cation:proton antiporter [Deltaproteobacteria bacterium]
MDFFLYLFIFLATGLFFVFLFTKLRLGPILGYLVAGIAMGPYALGVVHEAEFLHQVSELGLVFFLFLIGLEMSPKRIWHMKRAVFALGPTQMLISSLSMALISYFFIPSFQQALIIGITLALSSTAIGVQLLSEKNEITSPEGQDALGILIFQDLAVIPILAFLAPHASFSMESVLKPLGVVVAVITCGIFVIPKILRFLARSYRQELFVAASLLLVVGVAILMRSVGLSMALGAFIGGVVLANSEFRHELQTDIEPFKALLFGLFFISMGISLDLGFLVQMAVPVILASVSLLIFKSLANFIALYFTRLSSFSRAIRVAPLLGQGGEFAFVILGLAAGLGILSRELSTFFIGVVAISMALTPLWCGICNRTVKYFQKKNEVKREYDVVSENPEVIIAGYGRFGQIIHRILRLHQIPVTILESNYDQVEAVRKYGTKVFYGDATRLDLLKTAGAQNAKLFVLAIDQPQDSVKTAEILKKNFPKLIIFARARNREHSLRLIKLGIPQKDIVRETLHSSLNLTEDILLHLGMSCTMADQTIQSFLEHDAKLLTAQVQYLDDEDEMIKFTKESSEALQKLFEDDRAASEQSAA